MDPTSLLQRLHYTPRVSIALSRTAVGENIRVVTFSDDAADEADGADHAKDGEVLVLTGG